MSRRYQALSLLFIVIAGFLLTALLHPGLMRFWPFSAAEFVQQITPLFLIALLIERSIEVVLTPWRAKESTVKSVAVETVKKEIQKGTKEDKDLVPLHDDLVAYKGTTQRIAFLMALALGIVVSTLGVRLLGIFADPAAFKALPSAQQNLFNGLDVILTGALLAGGSDGLHKFVSIFTNFADSTAAKWKPPAV